MDHKYFFSAEFQSWLGAELECQAMGGELLSIGGLREQNCLVKYAHSNDEANVLESWYWTDGNKQHSIFLMNQSTSNRD